MTDLVQWGPRFQVVENDKLRELKADLEAELSMKLTDRQFILIKFGFDAPPLLRGGAAHRMVSHDVLCDSAITDHHRVEGLGEDQVFKKAQRQRERRKTGCD